MDKEQEAFEELMKEAEKYIEAKKKELEEKHKKIEIEKSKDDDYDFNDECMYPYVVAGCDCVIGDFCGDYWDID